LFSSSTRPYTASNKLDTTGSKSWKVEWNNVVSRHVTQTPAYTPNRT
jgi:hypothetical protein